MTTLEHTVPGAEPQQPDQALASILQATASSFAAARAVMETAAQTAFTFFADADDAERALLMQELSETTLVHDAIIARYAGALDTGAEGGNTLAKQLGYRSLTELLQHELGRRKRDTDTIVRLAAVLRDGTYPSLAVAVEDGRVSLQQAGVIIDVLDQEVQHFDPDTIESIEAAATEFAVGSDTQLPLKPEQLQKLVRAWFKQLQPERTELDANEQHGLRECNYGTARNGMVRVRALLPAEEGAAVLQFLDANAAPRVRFTDPELRETVCCCTDPDNRCGASYVSDPDETCSTPSTGNPATDDLFVTAHCHGCVPDDPRTRKQKMADAFSKAFSVAAKTRETSTQGGACPTLVVTIPVTELDKHAQGVPAVATLQRTEEVVPAHVAARILCDGAVQAAITGEDGEVLHLGRTNRLFTPQQRTALSLTYPNCAVGDCDIPSVWCEAHHVQWWSNGGTTDLDNGVLLCNYHHHQVHAGNLDIVPDRTTNVRNTPDPGHTNPHDTNPTSRRWRVLRRTRIRAGSSRPKQPNSGPNSSKRGKQSSTSAPQQLHSAGPRPGTNTPGQRRDRASTGKTTSQPDDDRSDPE